MLIPAFSAASLGLPPRPTKLIAWPLNSLGPLAPRRLPCFRRGGTACQHSWDMALTRCMRELPPSLTCSKAGCSNLAMKFKRGDKRKLLSRCREAASGGVFSRPARCVRLGFGGGLLPQPLVLDAFRHHAWLAHAALGTGLVVQHQRCDDG